jgi:cation-transporting P-type ATPase F
MNSKQYQNNLTVQAIYAGFRHYQVIGSDYSPEGRILEVSAQKSKCWLLDDIKIYSHTALRECLIAGILCSNSHLKKQQGQWVVVGDPIEGALIAAASKAKLNQSNLEKLLPKLDTIPFQSEFQYMATLHQHIDGKTIYIKGVLEEVLPCAEQMIDSIGNLISLDSKLIKLEADSMAKEGMGVIILVKKQVSTEKNSLKRQDLTSGLIFLGLQGLSCSSSLED